VKQVRQDAGPERHPGGLAARHSDEIVEVLRLAACLAARRDGLVLDPKERPDVRDIVGQVLGRRSAVVRQALLPPERQIGWRVSQVAAVPRVLARMLVAPKPVVQPKVARSARQAPLRALPPSERGSLDVLRDVLPATVRQAVQSPALQREQPMRFRVLPPSRVRQSQSEQASRQSPQSPPVPEHLALALPSYPRPWQTCPLPQLLRRPPGRGNAYARARHASDRSNSSASFFP
jgi:hypothetical protein